MGVQKISVLNFSWTIEPTQILAVSPYTAGRPGTGATWSAKLIYGKRVVVALVHNYRQNKDDNANNILVTLNFSVVWRKGEVQRKYLNGVPTRFAENDSFFAFFTSVFFITQRYQFYSLLCCFVRVSYLFNFHLLAFTAGRLLGVTFHRVKS